MGTGLCFVVGCRGCWVWRVGGVGRVGGTACGCGASPCATWMPGCAVPTDLDGAQGHTPVALPAPRLTIVEQPTRVRVLQVDVVVEQHKGDVVVG